MGKKLALPTNKLPVAPLKQKPTLRDIKVEQLKQQVKAINKTIKEL